MTLVFIENNFIFLKIDLLLPNYFFLLKPHVHKTIDGLILTFKKEYIYGLNWQWLVFRNCVKL